MNLDELLGVDPANPVTQRARHLVDADQKFLRDLIARRHALKLSQEEVARRMDVGQSAVARIESGTRDLQQSTLRRYAMAVEALVEHDVIPDDRPEQSSGVRFLVADDNLRATSRDASRSSGQTMSERRYRVETCK